MLRHHDVSDDPSLNRRMAEREDNWRNLRKRFLESLEPWSIEEIREVLGDIQEFVALDFPKKRPMTVEQLRVALDNVSRVALAFLTGLKDPREYATTKLCCALDALAPESEVSPKRSAKE